MFGRFWPTAGLLVAILVGGSLGPAPAAAADSTPTRGIIFVHGIHGDARLPGFQALLQPLVDQYPFESFTFFDDVANRDSATGQCAPGPIPESALPSFPVDAPAAGAPVFCDSEDDVGLNAILLDQEITRRVGPWNANRITLIANSMGGAIVRAYLAYATGIGSPSLASVDSILFLQGAQQGAWLGKADEISNSVIVSRIPGVRSAVTAMEQLALDRFQINPQRPAIADLTPQSQMYVFDSQPQYLPTIRYANVASDITTRIATQVWWWTVTAELLVRLGDYVMVPGFDDPTRTDWMGGARFLPSAIGRGLASTQWILPGDATIQRRSAADGSSFWDLGEVLNAPMSHFQLGTHLAELQVDSGAGQLSLDRALFDWITALDGSSSARLPASAPRARSSTAGSHPMRSVPAPSVLRPGGGGPIPVAASPGPAAVSRPLAPSTGQRMTFIDQQTGQALVLPSLGAPADPAGSFAFQVPDRGVYANLLRISSQQISPTRLVVAYDGPASLRPLIGSPVAGPPSVARVNVQLRAEVDPVHHTADATLIEGNRRFHLIGRPASRDDRAAVLASFEAASLAADWRSLYRLISHEVLGGHTESSLAAEGARLVSQTGRLRSVRRIAVGDIGVGQDGVQTFRATYQAERQAPDGSITSGRFGATFVEEGADWRLWYMDSTP